MANSALAVEENGLNVIPESERHGKPSDQFWPWAASNVSIFGISMAAWILGFGLSFGQAVTAGVIGIVFSFALVGVIALAGKRGSAPTLVLSRATFGVNGNALPTIVSYLLLVGWETVLVALGVIATSTVAARLGLGSGDGIKIAAFIVIIGVVIASGVFGFKFIMRIQKWITLASIALTLVFVVISSSAIDFGKISAAPSGDNVALVAGIIYAMTSFGLGWVNGGADYSRYLPRTSSSKGIFGWTTFGAAIAPAILVIYGFMLALSNADIAKNIGSDPIGALTAVLPTWFLIPFIILTLLGFMGGAILDIYSSGLNLLTLGLKAKRYQAAAVDGVLMTIGTIYFVFTNAGGSFFWPFQAGLYLLGVPMAAWTGIFIADLLLRKRDYDEAALYTSKGRYGSVNLVAVGTLVVATVVGYGFIASPDATLTWTTWEGYLYRAFGLADSTWYYSNIGVFIALVLGFVAQYLLGRSSVEKQER